MLPLCVRRGALRVLVVLVAVMGLATAAGASSIYTFSGAGQANFSQHFTYGFDFTAVQDITVDSLGFFDAGSNGLAVGHRVGIWTEAGTLLASATVTTGNSALAGPSINGGQFRYTPIAGLSLLGGVTYRFGAAIEGGPDVWYASVTNLSASPSLATVSANGFFENGDFVFPSSTIGNTYAVGDFMASPTLASVPEPSTLVLIGAGIAALRARRRQRAS